MTGTEISLIITAIGGLIATVVTAVMAGMAALNSSRARIIAEQNTLALMSVKKDVGEVKVHTNSLTAELVKVTGKQQRAEGEKEGRADLQSEIDARKAAIADASEETPTPVVIIPAAEPLPVREHPE